MATAQELFTLTTGEEQHIIIGSDRYITVPEPLKRIAVQFDHDVETVTFDCPRYWDDLDMSKMIIYVNYKLPDGTLDAYPAKNIKVDGDIMHFDWTISRNLTQYKGTITFLVCIKKTDTDGVEVNHWNSELCTDMYVSEGMECQEQAVMEYSDLVTQLLERMAVVEQINVNADEMREMHEEVLNETTGIRQTAANAIKSYAVGEYISVNDVSPVEHIVDVSVHGKNLISYPYDNTALTSDGQVTIAGVTYTDNKDGSIRVVGTVDTNTFSNIMIKRSLDLKDGVKYYIGNSPNLLLAYKDELGVIRYLKNQVFTWSNNYEFIQLYVQYSPEVVVDETLYPMLCVSDVLTDYEPYIDPSTVKLAKCGKNLIDFSRAVTYNCVINGDGITSNIKDLYYCEIRLPYLINYIQNSDGKTVTFSVANTVSDTSIYIVIMYSDGTYDQQGSTSNSVSLTINNRGRTVSAVILRPIAKATTFTDTTSIIHNVQLEINETATDFEEQKGFAVYTPNVDGTCDITSMSPNMTLLTDTPGITIDCEYNKDMRKVVSGANADMYMFSMQQLADVYSKYGIPYSPITVTKLNNSGAELTLNGLPALKIIYRLYTGVISNGVLTKLFDMPIKYNITPDINLLEDYIANVSDFKSGYGMIANTWLDMHQYISRTLYNGAYHNVMECTSCINYNNIYGVAYALTVSFEKTNIRDTVMSKMDTLIQAASHIGWEYKPTKHTIITPKYLGE